MPTSDVVITFKEQFLSWTQRCHTNLPDNSPKHLKSSLKQTQNCNKVFESLVGKKCPGPSMFFLAYLSWRNSRSVLVSTSLLNRNGRILTRKASVARVIGYVCLLQVAAPKPGPWSCLPLTSHADLGKFHTCDMRLDWYLLVFSDPVSVCSIPVQPLWDFISIANS